MPTFPFVDLVQLLLAGWQQGHPTCKNRSPTIVKRERFFRNHPYDSNTPHWPITLSSFQPTYPLSLLSYHIPARSFLLAVPRVLTAFISRLQQFQHCCPQSGTYSLLAFALVRHHIKTFRHLLKVHCFEQAFRFGLWLSLCTINDFIYLLTVLTKEPWNSSSIVSAVCSCFVVCAFNSREAVMT